MGIIFFALVALAVTALAVRRWVRSNVTRLAESKARKVLQVWAAQGPFRNGTESASAMRYAWLAITANRAEVDEMAEQLSNHVGAFDANPRIWEENRKSALESGGENVAAHAAEAARMRAVDAWRKESVDFDNIEAAVTLGLRLPFTAADVVRAYEKQSSRYSPHSDEARRLRIAHQRAHRLAQLSRAAGILKGSTRNVNGTEEIDFPQIRAQSRTLSQVLQADFLWNSNGFAHGMAPLHYRKGRQLWRPKTRLLTRLVGGSNGPAVPIDVVVKPGCFLKFVLPSEDVQETLDFQNWRGYLDREVTYSTNEQGRVLDRWVRFLVFSEDGFRFEIPLCQGSCRLT